jgi:hypothetical protein
MMLSFVKNHASGNDTFISTDVNAGQEYEKPSEVENTLEFYSKMLSTFTTGIFQKVLISHM